MTGADFLQQASSSSNVTSIIAILCAMAIISGLETVIPLRGRGRANLVHLTPNLTLTVVTFATNILLGAALVVGLAWVDGLGFGVLNWLSPAPSWAELAVVLVALDFSFYAAHVAMHKVPALWRYHRVHHADPAVDVTTTLRQHPGEGVVRYAFLTFFAVLLGASPAAFALYRSASALNGLLEHADIRVPAWADWMLSLVTTWPGMHKVHHSRRAAETDSNYGNLLSLWDRLFGTFVPASRGRDVDYGLDGFDDRRRQTAWGLLLSPYRRDRATNVPAKPACRNSSAR